MVLQTDRCFACTGCPHAPRRGIGVRTRQRHLAAAPGSGTLPPLCIIERREERGCRGAPLPRGGQGGGEEPPALRRRGSGHLSAKKAGRCAKRTLSGGSPASWPYWLYYRLSPYPKVKQGVFRHCRKTPCARTGTLPVWGAGGEASPLGAGGKAPGRRRHSPVIFAYGVLQRERGGDILSGKTERVDDGFSA